VAHVSGAAPGKGEWSLALGPVSPEPAGLEQARDDIHRAIGKRDADAAGRAANRALDLALADGCPSLAVDRVLETVFSLDIHRLDPRVTERLLHQVETAAQRYPKGRGDLAGYRGLHHWWQGATQDAAESLRDAARHAVRLEDPDLAADSIPIYAETLAQLGYFEEARRWVREGLAIVRERRNACDLGSALRTAGWVSLRLGQRGQSHDDPARLLEEALRVFGEGGPCPRPDKLGGARLSLALLALDQGRLDEAAAHLQAIDRAALSLDERVHVDDVAMRLALARGDGRGRRAAYERLRESTAAVATADARRRLHTRRGRLLELEGDAADAIEAYQQAELVLDELVRLQAVGIGRGELADRHHESTVALASLLVDRGDVDGAWCIVRQDQARRRTAAAASSTLDDTARGELDESIRRYRREKLEAEASRAEAHGLPRDEAGDALRAAARAHDRARSLAHGLTRELARLAPHPRCIELSPPGPGELLLGLYPREHDWWLLVSDGIEPSVHIVPTPRIDGSREALAAALLEPVASRLEAATRVRVLAHGKAQHIDVHALPWRGEPLGVQMPVSYGVELPVVAAAKPGRRALLVADPTGTLEGAEAEVEQAAERLAAAGWATKMITASNATAPGTVSLAGYDLFHYAGHAEASARPERGGWPPYPGGEAGWAAFLELGPAGRLDVHDVTTTRPAPRAVVLAGCRTGALELDTGQTSMALAFLVAGSEQVVASVDAVEDARGARLARGLYEALVREPGVDLALAMQRAQRGLWEAGEEPAGYRVWVR
jgi:tetratricopeptide (TPR) repeat protein